MDHAQSTSIDRLAGAHQRYIDDEAQDEAAAEALAIKAAAWLNHANNVFEISGWFSDEQHIQIAKLDALINYELSRPYSPVNMSEIEVGVREYAEKKRDIFIDCAVQYADRFNNFEDEEVQ
jgi:hypothetical protein